MATLGTSWTTVATNSQTKLLYDSYYRENRNYTITYTLQAKLTSQSTDENKSYIATQAIIAISPGSIDTYNLRYSCTGCTSHTGNNSTRETIPTGTVLTGSTTVSHNSNGTGSLSMSGSFSCNMGGYSFSASGSITLPTIPRNSSITVFNNFTIEDGFSFTYKDELASKTLTLTCKIGNTSILTKTYTSSVGSHTDSIIFTAAQLTTIYGAVASNSKTAEFTLSLSTSGITTASTKTATGTLKASLNSPSLSDITVDEVGNVASHQIADNQVLRYLSKKVIRASASAQHGATVSAVQVTNGQVSAQMGYMSSTQKYTSTTMSNLETGTFVVTVTDSRGFTTSGTLVCELLDYTYPTITNVEFDRTSNIQDSGYVRANGTFWNKLTYEPTAPIQIILRVQVTIVGGGVTTSYSTQYIGIPDTTSLSWNIEQLVSAGVLLRDQTYTCTVTVTDEYEQTATYTAQLGLAKRALWLGKYTVKAEGIVGEHWIGFYKVGDIFLTLNTENPADRFGGTWQLISQGKFLLGSDSTVDSQTGELDPDTGTYKAGDTGGAATVTLTENQIPAHTHWVWENGSAGIGNGSYGDEAYLARSAVSTAGVHGITSSTGSGQAHNNMPPYLVCYIWQKTA